MNKVRATYKRSLAKDEYRMKTAMSSSKCSMWGGSLVAHEIGHGVYKFQHTFDYGVAEKSTDNLMDYNNGDFLAHYQWRVMQDSVMLVWGLFQDDEDGMGMTAFSWLYDDSWMSDDYEKKVENIIDLFDYIYKEGELSGKPYWNTNLKTDQSLDMSENENIGKWTIRYGLKNNEIIKKIHEGKELQNVKLSGLDSKTIYIRSMNHKFDKGEFYSFIAIYSFVKEPTISYNIGNIENLSGNNKVRAGYRSHFGGPYGLIPFYDKNGELLVVVQVLSDKLGKENSINTWAEYLLASQNNDSKSKTEEKEEKSSKKVEVNIDVLTDHYVVFDEKAKIRNKKIEQKNKSKKPQISYDVTEKIIEQGTEVVIEETDGDIVKVKYIYPAKTDEHYTSMSNLKLIEKITPEIKKFEDNAQSFILPYRTKETDKNSPNPEKDDECTAFAKCGLYRRVYYDKFKETSNKDNSKGYWVHLKEFKMSDDMTKKIQDALKEMEKYIGTPYNQDYFGPNKDENAVKKMNDYLESDERIDKTLKDREWTTTGLANFLRTSKEPDALSTMDCTEFMARFVAEALGLDEVPNFPTNTLDDFAQEEKCYKDHFCFVRGSKSRTFRDIRPGDMFIWKSGSGHVGVVESFIKGEKVKDGKKVDDPDSDKVVVLEAIAKKGAADESDCPKDCNGKVCKNQVRKSIYKRNSKSLNKHKGWLGFFRLIER